jgi:hypothetical protein
MEQIRTDETSTPAKKPFEFFVGTGAIRAKVNTHNVILWGGITLPKIGPCYIDGTRAKDAAEMDLEVIGAKSRKVVAHLVIGTKGTHREGFLFMADGRKKHYRVVAEVRTNVVKFKQANGQSKDVLAHRLVLRLPEVKVQGTGWV